MNELYLTIAVVGLGSAAYMYYQNRKLSGKLIRSQRLLQSSSEGHTLLDESELLQKAEETITRIIGIEDTSIAIVVHDGEVENEVLRGDLSSDVSLAHKVMTLPLLARDRQVGVLHVSHVSNGSKIGNEQLEELHQYLPSLALAIDNAVMYESLQQSVDELQLATALKERLESELQIAGSIQLSFLPTTMPSSNEPFDVCALLKSAKEVGGDFYNFFKLDEDHLFFTLGDVSDKGIPAALFMAMTLSLLKGNMNAKISPGDLLEKVNDELCTNSAQLFATIVCGVLNIHTGEVILSDGGHCTPFVVKANGDVLPIKLNKGIPLGSFPEFTYANDVIALDRGDRFVLYTDGITEAENAQQEQYSEARLERFLGMASQYSSAEIIDALLMDVFMFADGAPQSDDIAVLCLMRR